ncbi:MAG: hypothetical protein CJD30_06775 [Sulfuricurvum sp. PD_MW2]|jgi:uncharacterized protein YcfL|uniref:DUF1425 domain-containing protein n=1 Tax=Sulfuricurvum sp. PD_MW2 TaxID=2027917 RepID=UPI000C05E4BA|nr:DUF1425 domain-containing protein [Sulfuricurvum sp. PD_MW2]PHM17327.1 MAG: hypothetical protein CJD30_06775 [Sulfuricurvum sp. PD_MW2]
MLNTKKTLLSITVGSFMLLGMSGCAGKNQEHYIGKERVILKEHKSFQEGKFLKVAATFENEDNTEVEGMVYQVEWIDSRGIVVDQTAWKPFTIIGKQQIRVVDMANRPDVTDYRIIISTPNK